MSFDLAVLSATKPLQPDAARHAYERLAAGDAWDSVLAPDPRIDDFVKDINRRWPQPKEVAEDRLDSLPWAADFEITPASVMTLVRWDRAEEMSGAVIETAKKHGLYIFDPQEGVLYMPSGEHERVTPRPQADRVCALCSRPIGPNDMTIERPGREGVFHLECGLGAQRRPSS